MRPSDVSSRYGAPMGRSDSGGCPQTPVTISEIPIDAGGYDQGGAYWGTPSNLFVVEDTEDFRKYMRSGSLADLRKQLQKDYPDIQFAERQPDLDAFLEGYLTSALFFSEFDESDTSDFAPEDRAKAEAQCRDFINNNFTHFGEMTDSSAGHDFWLTRNGIGSGFFDRDILTQPQRDALTMAAKACGEAYIYLDADGKSVHFD